jgi:hypothetical protein
MFTKGVASVLLFCRRKRGKKHNLKPLCNDLKLSNLLKQRMAIPFAVFPGFGRITLFEKVGEKQL